MGMYIRIFIFLVLIILLVGGYFFFSGDALTRERVVDITASEEVVAIDTTTDVDEYEGYVKADNASGITGLPCESGSPRSLAIMYSGDVETRPYFSGIADAGFVVEMDHRFTHGGTRVMGIFDCVQPAFVGPMRSGRVDFVNLAGAFDAIYVPWGGDSTSKSLLKKGSVDHIDCNGEVYPGGNQSSCFRRSANDVPLGLEDRAFSSAAALYQQAESLGYRMNSIFDGYEHQGDAQLQDRPSGGSLEINLAQGFDVQYSYNSDHNTYERSFSGRAEYDFQTRERVAPKNVILIKTSKDTFYANGNYVQNGLQNPWDGVTTADRQSASGAYPNFALGDPWFDTTFSGEAVFYMDGQEVLGSWSKERRSDAPFMFYHSSGREITFVPGQIWLHVIDTDRSFTWDSL